MRRLRVRGARPSSPSCPVCPATSTAGPARSRGGPEAPVWPGDARRNVVTRGIDLNALVGQEFQIGTVRCIGRRLCEPCSHLQRLTGTALLRPMVHRGGLRADILTSGVVRVGDAIGA